MILAGLVFAVWLFRLRRRARRAPINEHQVVCGLVGALAIGLFGAFAVRLFHLPPTPIAVASLVVLLVLGLRPSGWKTHLASNTRRLLALPPKPAESPGEPKSMTTASTVGDHYPHRARGTQIALGCAGVALFALGATFATAAARKDQVPPAELSIGTAQVGTPVASVDLGSAAPVSARLEVIAFGHPVWSTPLSSSSTSQNVAIPSDLDHSGSYAVLVAGREPIRLVALPGEP